MRLFNNNDDDKKPEVIHADNVTADNSSVDAEKAQVSNVYVKTEAEKRFVRKVGWTFLPLVTWIVMVQFADKSALAISAVLGIYEDTGISGSQFSWLGSIFFLGYLVFQVPNQILVQKFPTSRYLGVCIVIWGSVMFFTALGNTFSELAALRFLLGLFEATCLPCIYLIIANLYRREEQTLYFGIATMCQGIGAVLGNFVAVGVSNMGNREGIAMWRWNHIIFGALTVTLGILCFFFLVDSPRSKLLRLTPEEHEIVDRRTRDNAVVRTKKIHWPHFIEALKEPRLYLIFFAAVGLNMQNGGLLVFSAQLIRTLGSFTPTESILLKIPGGVASCVFSLLGSILARKLGHIAYVGMAMCVISGAGCLILTVLENGPGKLAGYYLSWGMSGASALLAATIGNNVSGYSKKIFYNSVYVAATTVGQFIGPLLMLEREAPKYLTGPLVFTIGNGIAFVCFILNRIIMARENKRRLANPPEKETDVTLGLTDVEDRNFIYRL
ncbi:major facilitator superfamily domain-containing protein [Fennellomyces sp. T-0311]|nr:major facilitator superfamily domain-containing protein [Fennellomyces sp. T-0311]